MGGGIGGTVKELVHRATWETGGAEWFPEDREQLEAKVEAAINEAIERCAQIAESGYPDLMRPPQIEVFALIAERIRAMKSI